MASCYNVLLTWIFGALLMVPVIVRADGPRASALAATRACDAQMQQAEDRGDSDRALALSEKCDQLQQQLDKLTSDGSAGPAAPVKSPSAGRPAESTSVPHSMSPGEMNWINDCEKQKLASYSAAQQKQIMSTPGAFDSIAHPCMTMVFQKAGDSAASAEMQKYLSAHPDNAPPVRSTVPSGGATFASPTVQSGGNGSAGSSITTGSVCANAVPNNIGAADRTCQSNACYPGPDGDSNWYCTLKSSNCAYPGTTGAMYGQTMQNGSFKCVSTGPGGRAHFAAVFGNGNSSQVSNGNASDNARFTYAAGQVNQDLRTWIGTYSVSITNTGSVGLSCRVDVHGSYDPAAGESAPIQAHQGQPFSQTATGYVPTGGTVPLTVSGFGLNHVDSYNPSCHAQ